MAKFGGSAMTKIGNAAKRVSKSKVVRKTKIAGKKAVRGAKSGVAKFKGAGGLRGAVSKIKPIAADLKQGGVRKINKIVEAKAQNLIPKLTSKIEEKVDSFDPSKFLGKIFDGGLDSLNGFAGGLDKATDSMKKTMEFLKKAQKLATSFVEKLSKAKKQKKKGGGLIKNIFKGLAIAGVAMLAAPTIAKVGLVAGAAVAGKSLIEKGINFIRRRKKKKLEKKKEKDKENKKGTKTDTIFSGILSKLDGVLNFKKSKEEKQEEGKTKSTPVEQSIEPFMLGGLFGGKKKEKNKRPENYQDLVDAGWFFNDSGYNGTIRNVTALSPEKTVKTGGLFSKKKKIESQFYDFTTSGFGSEEIVNELSLPLEDYINLKLFKIKPEGVKIRDPESTEVKEEKKKNVRGSGAKDRGREGGNFSGEKQKNVRGEFAKGFGARAIGKLFGKGKDLAKGLVGGIGGLGGKIGSGIAAFLKSDAANFLSGGLTGAAGKIGGKLLSFIRGDKKSVDARDSVAETISQPVPTGGESSDTDGGGGAGAAGAVINSGAPGAVASANPMSRDRTKPSNLALALIAVDTRNIHILQSKSVFNIVDAI